MESVLQAAEVGVEGTQQEVTEMRFARWMASPRGRAPRIVLGLTLIAFGIYLQSPWGIVIAVLGVVPLASGVDNFCLVGPLFGGGVDGRRQINDT